MKCPHDGAEMEHLSRHGVEIEHCPSCGGIWLDRGELDHLLEAVRPVVTLDAPEPEAPPPPRPKREDHARGERYTADKPKAKRAVRFEDRERERERSPEPGKGRRYGGAYSGKAKLKNILEEIFDFD